MSDEVRVDPGELRRLRSKVSDSSSELDSVSFIGASLTSSNRVSEAYDDFAGEWDKRRKKLVEGLTKAAEALGQVASSFEDADKDLAGVLTDGAADQGNANADGQHADSARTSGDSSQTGPASSSSGPSSAPVDAGQGTTGSAPDDFDAASGLEDSETVTADVEGESTTGSDPGEFDPDSAAEGAEPADAGEGFGGSSGSGGGGGDTSGSDPGEFDPGRGPTDAGADLGSASQGGGSGGGGGTSGSDPGAFDPGERPADAGLDLDLADDIDTPGTDLGEFDLRDGEVSEVGSVGDGPEFDVGDSASAPDGAGAAESGDESAGGISTSTLIGGAAAAAVAAAAAPAIRKATAEDDDPILAEFEREMGR